MKQGERISWQAPAMEWRDAVPMGNGFLGAMVYGHTGREKIQLNDDSLWYGKGQDRINDNARGALPQVQRLILEGRYREAEQIMFSQMISSPSAMRNYSTLGELDLALEHEDGFPMFWFPESDGDHYEMALQTTRGLLTVDHTYKGTKYHREMFVSYPRRLLCLRLTCDPGKTFRLDAALNRYPFTDDKVPDDRRPGKYVSCGVWPVSRCDRLYTEDSMIVMEGNEGGTRFAAAALLFTDGEIQNDMSRLAATGASQVTIYLTSSTDNRAEDPLAEVKRILAGVRGDDYDRIRQEHMDDFASLMERCTLQIDEDERAADYFQYARYLMASSSRPGSQAMNLQGIWNKDFEPSWDSKHTLNINQEMNYWPAEVCNLSELHEPQFDLIHKMEAKGEDCARRMYGCRGMVFHHNTDFYGDCGTQDVYSAATFWPMGAAWMAMHIWDHFLYTQDLDFLRREYRILQKASLFFIDFLIPDQKGYLVTCPSVSPENRFVTKDGYDTPICAGPAMDRQLIRALFQACLAAADYLGIQEENRAKMEEILSRLKPDGIGENGCLLEWAEEEEELTPDMGHVSHLVGAYPLDVISDRTPELMQAARKSLERRIAYGANPREWPGAWRLALFARFRDGDKTGETLQELFDHSLSRSYLNGKPVFQIDANMGILAGMAECLLQSHQGIDFLPALPAGWKNGEVTGLKARGNLQIGIKWKGGQLEEALVQPYADGSYFFRGQVPSQVSCGEEVLQLIPEQGGFHLELQGGKSYRLSYQ